MVEHFHTRDAKAELPLMNELAGLLNDLLDACCRLVGLGTHLDIDDATDMVPAVAVGYVF